MGKTIEFILFWSKFIYPLLVFYLFFLDYVLFIDFFGFEKGLFFDLFKQIDIISINSIIIMIIMPFVFIGLYISISIFAFKEYNFRHQNFYNLIIKESDYSYIKQKKSTKNYFKQVNEDLKKKEVKTFLIMLFLFPLILWVTFTFLESYLIVFLLILVLNTFSLFYILKLQEKFNNILLFTSFFITLSLFIYSILIICIRSIEINSEIINFFYKYSYIHTYLKYFFILNFLLFMNYIIMIMYADLIHKKETSNSFKILSSIIIFLLVCFFSFNKNKGYWSEEINSNKEFSTNLIFNKGNIQTNYSDISVKIPYKYYSSFINQIKFDDSKNITTIKNNNEYVYTLDEKYFCLNISQNIKMYFKNLFVEKDFIGYRIFIVEEKKYLNNEGSEFVLLNIKNKFIKNIDDKKYLVYNSER